MRQAAQGGADYLPAVLSETGQSTAGLMAVNTAAFTGWTREGMRIDDALHASIRVAKQAVAAGHSPAGALLLGGRSLDRVVPSVIADADRGAVQAGLTTTTSVGGYVRMLNGPSCGRCIVLAGKWYAWNQGFQRHPHCDCRHIPASESLAGNWATDPYEAFRRMSPAEQDRAFGATQARAIRDGADIYRVHNSRRGLPSVKAYKPPRLTLDEIYRQAGTRTRAVAMLTEQGWILPGGQQAGGVLAMDAQTSHYLGAGALGRGGTRKGATMAHRYAATTGKRDPLNRYTQTAAERRLGDSVLSVKAVSEGRNPYGAHKLNESGRRRAAAELDHEVRKLRAGLDPNSGIRIPAQVYRLADLLGVDY